MNSSTKGAGGRNLEGLLLLTPSLMTLFVFLVIPSLIVLRLSFYPGNSAIGASGWSLHQYIRFFGEGLYPSVLLETVLYALATCVGCLVLGFPVGYSLARMPAARRRWMMLMVIVPLTLSLVIVVFGWMVLLGRQGMVNNILVNLGIVDKPLRLLYNRSAVIVVLIQQFLPFMILSVMNVVMQIDGVLEQASTSLRANRLRTFAKVILPLSMPGIMAGVSLIFVMAVAAFVTPRLIGGPRAQMVGGLVYDQVLTTGNWPFGAAMSFILLIAGFGLLWLVNIAVLRPFTRGLHV